MMRKLALPLLTALLVLTGCTTVEETTTLPEDNIEVVAETFDSKNWEKVTIIDIRTPEEFEEGHLEGAVNIDFYEDSFVSELDSLDKDDEVLIYCRSGNRSGQASEIMQELGFTNIIDAGPLENAAQITEIDVVK